MTALLNFLKSLPVGYMFAYSGQDVPEDFMEVSGQTISRSEYELLYQVMSGIIVDHGDTFSLPHKRDVQDLFPTLTSSQKIIIKVR